MAELFTMALAAILINNVVLSKFLGVCPFLGVSKNSKSAIGMGLAVIFVIFGASLITYAWYSGSAEYRIHAVNYIYSGNCNIRTVC